MAQKTKKKAVRVIAVIAAAAVILAAVLFFGKKNGASLYNEETAQIRDISTYYSFTGNVETDSDTNVLSSISQKVLSVNFSEGDTVHKGDVIAVLDSSDIRKSISVKEANMSSSELSDSYSISSAFQTYNDYKNGIENGNNSQLNSAQSSLDNAQSNLESAKKKYDDAKSELDNSTDSSLISARKSAENAKNDLDAAQQDYDDYLAKMKTEDYYSIKTQKEAMDKAYDNYNDKLMGKLDGKKALAEQEYESLKSNYDYLYNLSQTDSSAVSTDELSEAKLKMENAKSEYETLASDKKTVSEYKELYDEAADSYERAKKSIDDSNDSQLRSLSKTLENAQRSYDNAVRTLEDTEKSLNKNIDTYYESYISAQRSYDEALKNFETVSLSVEQTLDSYKTAYDKTVELSGSTANAIELEDLYSQLDECTIYANADGEISQLNISENGYISANQTAAVITDYSKLKIVIKIDEYDIGKFSVGDTLDVYINALDKHIEGTVDDISSKAETSGGVSYFTADVSFTADENVRSGMSAEVKLISREVKNAVSVSVDALNYNDDNSAYILVKNEAGEPEMRSISVGVSDGTYIEITEGVSEGEIVLYTPTYDFSGMMRGGISISGGEN